MIEDTQGNKDMKKLFELSRLEILEGREIIVGKGEGVLRISWQEEEDFSKINRLLLGAMLLSEKQLGFASKHGLLVTDQKDNVGSIIALGFEAEDTKALHRFKSGGSFLKVNELLTKMWDTPPVGVVIDGEITGGK